MLGEFLARPLRTIPSSGMYGYWIDFIFFVVMAISTLRISVDSSEIEATFWPEVTFHNEDEWIIKVFA